MSGTFCPLPWIAVAMRNNGDLRVCCHSHTSVGKGIAIKDDKSLFNAGTDSLEEFRNADLLKSIRKNMLAGEWHENCVRCQKEVAAGVRARLHYETELRSDLITEAKAKEWTAPDGAIDIKQVPLSLLDVRFGNECNLACRTCNPTESNRWYKDHLNLYGETFKYHETTLSLRSQADGKVELVGDFFNWYEKPTFNKDLAQTLKNVSEIYISGGEPLKTKEHTKFLERMIELGYNEQITLEYNTNGYLIPDEIWLLWDQFKQVKIGLSIDSVYQMNDYIRYPSRWSVIEKNMAKLDQTGDRYIIWLALTVHCYNIYYLPEIITWRLKSQFKKINRSADGILISDHPLHNPKHLNIQILPPLVKMKIKERFAEFKKTLPELAKDCGTEKMFPEKQIVALLDGYERFMMQEDKQEFFPKFISYTEKMDNLRQESFANTFSEFNSLLSLS